LEQARHAGSDIFIKVYLPMFSILLTQQSVSETDKYSQSTTHHISWQWQPTDKHIWTHREHQQ